MTIYERIKMLRKNAGMSQEELARRCGYREKSMISRIESGKVDMPFSKVSVPLRPLKKKKTAESC